MKLFATVVVCCALMSLAACCTVPKDETPTSGSQKADVSAAPVFPELDAWLAQNGLVVTAGEAKVYDYDRAFAQGAVIAYGEGLPRTGAEGAGQKRLTALTAAEAVAKRNLAAYFARYATDGQIRFDSGTVRLESFLRGVAVVAREYNADREKAAVLVKLDIRGYKGFAAAAPQK